MLEVAVAEVRSLTPGPSPTLGRGELHRLRHRGDPTTSLHAARSMRDSGALALQEAEVLEMVRANPGLTFEELAQVEGSRLDKYAVARRLPALHAAGLVFSGVERRTSSGRFARTWEAVKEERGTRKEERQGDLL